MTDQQEVSDLLRAARDHYLAALVACHEALRAIDAEHPAVAEADATRDVMVAEGMGAATWLGEQG